MSMLKSKICTGTAVLLTGTALFCGAACEAKEEQKAAMQAPLVVVDKVSEIAGNSQQTVIGQVEATASVELQVRVAGTITSVDVKDGDWVKAGQLIATIEDTVYKARVQAAKANVAQLAAEVEYAESNYNRHKTLITSNATAKANFDEATRMLKNAKARYDAACAALTQDENDLSYCRIVAPIAGRIGRISQTFGNYVSLSSPPLATIVSLSPVYVKFSLSERDYLERFGSLNDLLEHAQLKITTADGKPYKGKLTVKIVDNQINRTTGTISIWAESENTDGLLIPGGYVNVTLGKNDDPMFCAVPLAAILTDKGGSFVYILGRNNMPEKRYVKLGAIIRNIRIAESGLTAGETIIVDGLHKIIPGMPVNPSAAEGK